MAGRAEESVVIVSGWTSAETDLGKDALAGEQLGGEADHEAEHGEAAVPSFSKSNETETGIRGGHGG